MLWCLLFSTEIRVVEFRDITEEKQTEDILRFTKYSIDNIIDSIFWVDSSGKCIFVNNSACKTLGYSREELLQLYVYDIDPLFSKEQWEKHWQNLVQTGFVVVETIHNTKDGKQIPVEVTANLVEYRGKQYNCGVARDITARKHAEEKQKILEANNRRLQKVESLGRMAGGIAHLFNNYLYVVIGNLELALDDLPENSISSVYLIEAMKATRRCSDVSGTMLTYLGQNISKSNSLDITQCCKRHLELFGISSNNSNITIESKLLHNKLIVHANESQMQQVLSHLLTNACESIGDKKGKITISTKIIQSSQISKFYILPINYKITSDEYACIEVSDNGCGIPAENIYKISDPFFTTKFTGRGLGLAVVLGLLKAWNGMIGVNSKTGQGSTFMVFLPLSSDSLTNKKSNKPVQTQRSLSSLYTILLVDDHEMVRNMAAAMLKRIGFKVILAENGIEAIKIFQNNKESISCLITDLSMPALDGWKTLSEIRKIKPGIPAILASGYNEEFAMSHNYPEKPNAFIHKPYSMADLKGTLRQILNYD